MDSYFGKKLSGGRDARAGMRYQDYCALISMFKYSRCENFQSITIETLNDFTILMQDIEISVQVKKESIGLSLLRQLLQKVKITKGKQFAFVGSFLETKVELLLRRKETFLNSLDSCRLEDEKKRYLDDFIEVLNKLEIKNLYNEIMASDFLTIAEGNIDIHLNGVYNIWIDECRLSVNKENLLNELKVRVMELGVYGGELKRHELEKLINQHYLKRCVNFQPLKETCTLVLKNLERRITVKQCIVEEIFEVYYKSDKFWRDDTEHIFYNEREIDKQLDKDIDEFLIDIKASSPYVYSLCTKFIEFAHDLSKKLYITIVTYDEPPGYIYEEQIQKLQEMYSFIKQKMNDLSA